MLFVDDIFLEEESGFLLSELVSLRCMVPTSTSYNAFGNVFEKNGSLLFVVF